MEVDNLNSQGTVEIGYVFTFMISAMLLTAFTIITANIIDDFTLRATRSEAENTLYRIEVGISGVAAEAIRAPFTNITVFIPLEVSIKNTEYIVKITGSYIYLNTTNGIHLKSRIHLYGLHLYVSNTNGIRSIYGGIYVKYSLHKPDPGTARGSDVYLYAME